MQFTKVHQKLAKPVYEAIPRIAEKAGKKWEWEPKQGQWCFGLAWSRPDVPLLITEAKKDFVQINCKYDRDYPKTDFIPLLHWEDHLELILKEMGYDTPLFFHFGPEDTYEAIRCGIYKNDAFIAEGHGKDRQEAVQRGILALLEQLEEKQ